MDDALLLQVTIAQDIKKIFKVLRKKIVGRKISPGTRLREGDLALEFDVSRAKIREVITLLEHRGLIERQTNKGAVVRMYSLDELLDRFEIFGVLFGLATYQATKFSKSGTWQPFLSFLEKADNSDISESFIRKLLGELYKMQRQVILAANNDPLAAMIFQYYDILGPYIQKVFLVSQNPSDAIKAHKAIMEAMEKGEAAEAERLRREQLHGTQATLVKYYDLIV